MQYSVIFDTQWNSADGSPWLPKNFHLWQKTEGDDQNPYDYLNREGDGVIVNRHRKYLAILSQQQFDDFVEGADLVAEDVQTMGSIGAPGFGWGWAPAISFTNMRGGGRYLHMASAYVTPIPDGEPPDNDDEMEAKWEEVREEILEKYGCS